MYSACLKSLFIPRYDCLISRFYISAWLGSKISLDSLIGNHMGHLHGDNCIQNSIATQHSETEGHHFAKP